MKPSLTDYFSIYRTELPGIKETIQLPRGVLFRYDGEVSSLIENEVRTELIIKGLLDQPKNIFERLLKWPFDKISIMTALDKISPDQKAVFDDLIGYCNPHKIDERTNAYVLAVKKGLEKNKRIFAEGHETGEFLDDINYQHILQQFLDKEGINLNVLDYKDEDFADIGGLLALLKASKLEEDIVLPIFKARNQILEVLAKRFEF